MEVILRKGGIKVNKDAKPYLWVRVTMFYFPSSSHVVYQLEMVLKAPATVVGTKKIVPGELWSSGGLSSNIGTPAELAARMRATIIDTTNKFLNDWLAANQ